MASLHQLLAAVQQQVIPVTSGLAVFDSPLRVQVGIDWPPVRTIQQVCKKAPPTCLISIFDRRSSHDSTRWASSVVAQTITTATLTSSPTYQPIPPGGSAQLTLGGTITSGDAVSVIVSTRKHMADYPGDKSNLQLGIVDNAGAVVYSTNATDRVIDAAANLAAQINGANIGITATASGTVLTITNNQAFEVALNSYTGNGGTNVVEIGRRTRQVQITCWTASTEHRDTVGDPIESLIAQLEFFQGNFQSGLPLQDGTTARIMPVNDFYVDDATLSDTYRRDFIISADYSVTTTDKLYSVLAPILAYNLDY